MAPAKKTGASKKATGGRKYAPAASQAVEREMDQMKKGKLRLRNGQPVTNPKQAIAIGLSEARRAGAEMPPDPRTQGSAKKAATKKPASKAAAKKAPAKSASKKSAAKKAPAKSPSKKAAATRGSAKKAPAKRPSKTAAKKTARKS